MARHYDCLVSDMDLTDRNPAPPARGERVLGKAVRVVRSGSRLLCELDSGQLVPVPVEGLLTMLMRSDRAEAWKLPGQRVA